MTKKICEEKIKKLNEDIKNLSLQDVQLIALKVVTERVQKEIISDTKSLDYYENEASGTLKELKKGIFELEKKISWNKYLLDMLSVDSLVGFNKLSISPKTIAEYMGWDFNPYEETQKKAKA
tara:strand:+ start:115 stop:480 length:366 start_codon:yes stop_codon:yes gene_type:complete